MVQNYNFFVKPQSKNQPFSKKISKTADFSTFIMILPTWWQHDILHVVSLLEQRRDFIIRESSNATADAGNKERQILVLFGELDELIHVGLDSIYPTLHRWDAIALTLQAYALAHDGSKLAVGDIGRSTAVHTFEIAAKHKNLVRL